MNKYVLFIFAIAVAAIILFSDLFNKIWMFLNEKRLAFQSALGRNIRKARKLWM